MYDVMESSAGLQEANTMLRNNQTSQSCPNVITECKLVLEKLFWNQRILVECSHDDKNNDATGKRKVCSRYLTLFYHVIARLFSSENSRAKVNLNVRRQKMEKTFLSRKCVYSRNI